MSWPYILAGYPFSPYTLCPFTEPEIESQSPIEQVRRRQFNRQLSSICIRVEHAFGKLKGRFPALKDLNLAQDINDTYRDVQAMMFLHNLCINLGDEPECIPFFDGQEDGSKDDEAVDVEMPGHSNIIIEEGVGLPQYETDEWLREAGHAKRMQILDELFPL